MEREGVAGRDGLVRAAESVAGGGGDARSLGTRENEGAAESGIVSGKGNLPGDSGLSDLDDSVAGKRT